MMRGGLFHGGSEIKPLNEQAMELPKPLDTKSIPESSSALGEISDLYDARREGIESAEKSASDIQKSLIDDNGNEISDMDGNLKPNITYALFGIEYSTDDNGKIYCIDGEPLCNVTYVVDGITYKTDDKGNVYMADGKLLPNTTYELNGNKYTTDDKGRIISCGVTPHRTPENPEKNPPIQNKQDGLAREHDVEKDLHEQYPEEEGYEIVSEAYLRDKDGNIVKDKKTGEARRIDFVVIKDGKVVASIEVTSKTADKTEQCAKETRIRGSGGNYIKDSNGNLVEIPASIQTRIERRD